MVETHIFSGQHSLRDTSPTHVLRSQPSPHMFVNLTNSHLFLLCARHYASRSGYNAALQNYPELERKARLFKVIYSPSLPAGKVILFDLPFAFD